VQRAKQEAERLAAEGRENEARAHDLAKRHQGLLSEVETHTRTLQQARTDAEKHMNRTNLVVTRNFLCTGEYEMFSFVNAFVLMMYVYKCFCSVFDTCDDALQ